MGKRVFLTLKEKIKIIDNNEKGESARAISIRLQTSKTQVLNILKEKESLKSQWNNGISSERKRSLFRESQFSAVNLRVHSWFLKARSKHLPISGALLKEKAIEIAEQLGLSNFAASNGWLFRFQKRHGISSRLLSGVSASVSHGVVEEWMERLKNLTAGYSLTNIFNCDETALFYRAMPNRSLVVKNDSCHGLTSSKERLTILFCCSAAGEKLQPLVIGKSAHPRCFKGRQNELHGIQYESSRKAWITREGFHRWLTGLNNKMTFERRHILMVLDNCSSHADVQLSNVKLVFLPPHSTSQLQPLDAGIIRSFKARYRQRFLRHILLTETLTSSTTEKRSKVSYLSWINFFRQRCWTPFTG